MTDLDARPMDTLDIDAVVAGLREGERTWANTPLAERRQLLLRTSDLAAAHAQEWVDVAARIKQLDATSPLIGEEWLSGPYGVITYATALAETLERIDLGTDVLAGYRMRRAPGGRVAIDVMPHDVFDRLLLSGFRVEVWSEPGATPAQLRADAGLGARTPRETQGVALVLGAGNITSIPPLDVLYQLFADNRTVVLKLNPTMDALVDVMRAVLAPFIERGVVAVVTGGGDVGAALTQHPGIDAVHITGSEVTHDVIMWGPGEEGRAAKAAGTPRLTKPMTSELGGVSPVIVVPGDWSVDDLRFQAEHVATQRLHNGGFNCIAGQIVIVSSDWPQKDAFIAELRSAFATAPERPGWYPGCEGRVAQARRTHPNAHLLGASGDRTLLTGLDLGDADETAFSTEYFAPVLGVAELPGTGAEFLDAAVAAANEHLRGTLGANVLIDPATMKAMGPRFGAALAELRYGAIAVNAWSAFVFLAPRATWGAFPGHTPDDVQSGIGIVHNALMLEHVERSVAYGPFRPSPRSVIHGEMALSPKPAWFVTNRTGVTTSRLFTEFVARPRWSALPAIFASALRG